MKRAHYKLKAEIREFILQKAKEHPELGCRKLSGLIQEAFKVEVSKSSVSTIIKSEGLNKSVGRRGVSPQPTAHSPQLTTHSSQLITKLLLSSCPKPNLLTHVPASFPHIGCWFLKAADLCLGGTQAIAGALGSRNVTPLDLSAFLETLLYLPLCGEENYQDLSPGSKEAMAVITGKKYSQEDAGLFLNTSASSCERLSINPERRRIDYLEQAKTANPQILNQLLAEAREISKLKFILQDNSFFFLDAGSHTIWSTARIPECFSAGLYKTKAYLNGSILENTNPLVLQAPAGFDAPTAASLNFIASFQSEKPDKTIKSIELFSADNLLIDAIQPVPQKKRYFILGLWPWQYKETRHKLALRSVSYRECLKNRPDPVLDPVLDIFTNVEESQLDNEKVIGHYLEHWPNLETGYKDFLDKIGHFYQLSRSKIMHKNNVHFSEGKDLALNEIFNFWRWELNSYCQKYFFPLSYQRLDFLALKERFYNLRGKVISEANYLKVIFELPRDFLHTEDLIYGCQRVNEADIQLMDGRKLRFDHQITRIDHGLHG